MNTNVAYSENEDKSFGSRMTRWPGWVREPLLHFVLLGAALFAADHFMVIRSDDPRVIVIGPGVEQDARRLFKEARGRDPNDKELAALRQVWLDNEVLYREGLALQLDRGDPAIRDRVIFKALSMVDANVKPPAVDEEQLRTYFERNRQKYDEPARYDFQEAVIASEASEAAVQDFVYRLNKGTPGELDAGLRVYKGRPYTNVVEGYGDLTAKALEQATAGEWRAYETRDGWRAMRLEAITPSKQADFSAIKVAVYQDWIDETMAAQRSAAVHALARKYTIKYEAGVR